MSEPLVITRNRFLDESGHVLHEETPLGWTKTRDFHRCLITPEGISVYEERHPGSTPQYDYQPWEA